MSICRKSQMNTLKSMTTGVAKMSVSKRPGWAILGIVVLLTVAVGACGSQSGDSCESVRGLLGRVVPGRGGEFVFEEISEDNGRDVFEIETWGGKVVIRGNNGVSMAMGVNWYLKHYCDCHVSLFQRQVDLPAVLPEVKPKVRKVSWARHRYYLNYCCFGYSLVWWDWGQWERLIDWMALNGINSPLSVTGQEAVWQAVGERLGFGDEQMEAFLAGPPYLPFGWMGCLDGWGGPLPADWISKHEQLQKKILARQRALGMTPILQGFTGHVPPAVAEEFPEARLHKVHWIEWSTHLLDPLDALFAKISKLFIEEQTRRYGTDHLYAADTFIEMTPPSGDLDYLGNLSRAIYDGMAKSDPQAVWVLQGWAFMCKRSFWTQPRFKAFLDAIGDDRMLVLDLFCESTPMWSSTEAFCGKPWLWCNVQNFGNTVFLGGRLDGNNSGLMAAREHPTRGKLAGLGFVNEGLDYNPVVYDLMFEMAWNREKVDLNRWVNDYARHRYGRQNADAQAAWRILQNTVYSGANRSHAVLTRVPSLVSAGGSTYDNFQLAQAWRHLLEAGDELGKADTYRYDLVNVGRQVLSNHAVDLHGKIVEAHKSGDAEAFGAASAGFLQLIRDMDELVGTRKEFLLGKWLEDAKRWGRTDAERSKMEWNARRVLTLWGSGANIRDYARKEWSGMLNGFYLHRWQWYLRELGAELEEKGEFDQASFKQKLWQWEKDWTNGAEMYPAEPRGDSVAVANRLWARYGEAFKPAPLDAASLTTGKPATSSSLLLRYPASAANDGYARNTNRFWATDVKVHNDPEPWWQVDLEEATEVGTVVVICFFGDDRYYGFAVETSLDGKTWKTVADRRNNKEPSTSRGYTCKFKRHKVRYIRVTQTHNSANTGRHLVEVMAYEK
ncbi:MAG: alpha-N-acetylglucosaminidase TIM-barrel domain-containing protein [Planctomycetota bacterium]